MTKEEFRKYLVLCVKASGEMIIEMAEDIVGETDNISNLSIGITFDYEYMDSIPEITITRSQVDTTIIFLVPSTKIINVLHDIKCGKNVKEKE